MESQNIFKLLLKLGLPMVISMLFNSLYNIVDSLFIAQLGDDALNAISLIYPMQNLITAVAVGFGVGISSTISYYFGAKIQSEMNNSASLGLLYSLIHSIILTIICLVGAQSFLSLFTDNTNVLNLGHEYAVVAFAFTIPNVLGITFEKTFQGIAKMKLTMIALIAGCIFNIIFDPILIFGYGPFPEMGMTGAALATGLGQTLSLIIYVIYYIIAKKEIKLNSYKLNLTNTKKLYLVGIPATLNLALPSVLISALNGILKPFNEDYITILGIYYKLQTFIYLPANGFVQGMRPIVGYNYGAKRINKVNECFKYTFLLTLIIMLIGTILSLTIPNQILGLFSESENIINLGSTALRIISIGFIISAISITCCGVLEGLSKGLTSLIISLLRYIIIIIPLALILVIPFEANGVFIAFPITEFITAFISIILYFLTIKKINKDTIINN